MSNPLEGAGGEALHIGGYSFSAKNLFVIALILVGIFFAYVIFLKPKATATATASDTSAQQSGGGGVPTSSDPSAVGSIQTGLESLQQAAAAQSQTLAAQNVTLATINTNANSAARDASGARTDASIGLNGVNQILANQRAGKGDSIGGATYADYWHLANAGLGA